MCWVQKDGSWRTGSHYVIHFRRTTTAACAVTNSQTCYVCNWVGLGYPHKNITQKDKIPHHLYGLKLSGKETWRKAAIATMKENAPNRLVDSSRRIYVHVQGCKHRNSMEGTGGRSSAKRRVQSMQLWGLHVDTSILLALCISTSILLLYIYLGLF